MADMYEDTLYDAFYSIIPNTVPIIYSNQSIPEPTTTYVSIKPIHMNPVGMAKQGTYVTGAIGSETVNVAETYEWYVQINVVGPGADGVVMPLMTALKSFPGQQAFESRGLSIMRWTQVRRVPLKREDTWVDARNFEMYLMFEQQTNLSTTSVGYINATNQSITPNENFWVPSPPPSP